MAEAAFNVLKIVVIIAICSIFMVVIFDFLSLITSIIFGNVIGEFFALISMFLPFNAGVVFSSIGVAISAILSFLIAKKIFDLTSWSISSI